MNDLPSKKSCRVGNLSVSRVSVWLARIITSLRTCYSQREVIQDVCIWWGWQKERWMNEGGSRDI